MNSSLSNCVTSAGALLTEGVENHKFFEMMPPEDVQQLMNLARLEQFPTGEHIAHADATTGHFHCIIRGEIALETPNLSGKGVVLVDTLKPGDILGCSWLFSSLRWQYSARALTDVMTVSFDTRAVRDAIAINHDLGFEIAMRLGNSILRRIYRSKEQLFRRYER